MEDRDHKFMNRALELAALGRGLVSPNPMVGCVIVHEGKIIGEGYHEKLGEAHAEVNAINSVADQNLLSASTVYVTLEPCAHHGKTPPCVDLLIEKEVNGVVIATKDPFDQVDGKGIQKLENAGVKCTVGVLEKEANDLNKRFMTFHRIKRPYIILKWAQTSDRFVARENFESKWISNEQSRQLVHKWRTEENAILVGKNTAIYDNPSLTARDWDGRNPVRILLDRNLEVDNGFHLFDDQSQTLIFNSSIDKEVGSNRWITLDDFSSKSIMSKLYELDIQSIIIEGGAQTLNSFIKEDCWDEARVFTSQKTFGKGIPAPELNGQSLAEETLFGDNFKTYTNQWQRI